MLKLGFIVAGNAPAWLHSCLLSPQLGSVIEKKLFQNHHRTVAGAVAEAVLAGNLGYVAVDGAVMASYVVEHRTNGL